MTARQSKTGLGGGFPHSDIHGSKLVRSSPWLFAAYHVLHRLRVPRHPPNALKTLDRSHYQCPPHKRISERRVSRSEDIRTLFGPCMILVRSTRAGKTSITRDLPVKRLEDRSSFQDDIRTSLLFTMSEILPRPAKTQNAAKRGFNRRDWFWKSVWRSQNGWWSQTGSNRRPPACKAGALPTELWPLQVEPAGLSNPLFCRSEDCRAWTWWAWVDSNYRPHPYQGCALTN